MEGEHNIELNLLTINYFHLVEDVPKGFISCLLQTEILNGNFPAGSSPPSMSSWEGADLNELGNANAGHIPHHATLLQDPSTHIPLNNVWNVGLFRHWTHSAVPFGSQATNCSSTTRLTMSPAPCSPASSHLEKVPQSCWANANGHPSSLSVSNRNHLQCCSVLVNQIKWFQKLYPIPILGKPFEWIILDCVGPLPKTKSGHEYLLTLMCAANHFPEAVQLHIISSKAITMVKFAHRPAKRYPNWSRH